MKRSRIKTLTLISILGTLSFILMLIQVPLPFMPPFLTVDLSDIPAFIGFILLGPLPGIAIIALKILIYGILISSEPVGPIANFLASLSLLLPMYFIYIKNKSMKGLVIGFVVGILSLTFVMSLLNYFIFLPAYGMIVDLTEIMDNLRAVIAASIIPFNLLKGIIVAAVAILVYNKLIPKLKSVLK